jgi:nodulation protein E
MHGHCIGGTGAVELLAAIMAVNDGIIAPTINYEEPDPECDLDVVPNTAKEKKVDVAISNNFAFGGLNSTIAIRGM